VYVAGGAGVCGWGAEGEGRGGGEEEGVDSGMQDKAIAWNAGQGNCVECRTRQLVCL